MTHANSLFIDDAGTGGVPVVFLHSYAGSRLQWTQQLAHVRESRRAVAFDLRGHGKSPPAADGEYSIRAFVSDLSEIVDSTGAPQCVLVGHSLGGAIAMAYAGAHPARVAGLVLEEAPGKLPNDQVKQIKESLNTAYDQTMEQIWTRLLNNAQPSTRERVLRDRERLPMETSIRIVEAVFGYDPLPDLARYGGPALSIVSSTGDIPTALHNLIPGLAHTRIDGTSHWIHLDKPAEFNKALDEFLVSLSIPAFVH